MNFEEKLKNNEFLNDMYFRLNDLKSNDDVKKMIQALGGMLSGTLEMVEKLNSLKESQDEFRKVVETIIDIKGWTMTLVNMK